MEELQKQAALLRAQIEEAFADVVYPGDENLYDGGQWDDDYEDVVRNFRGKHWKDLIPKRRPPLGRSNPLSKDMVLQRGSMAFLPACLPDLRPNERQD